ncbi:MAG: hypothetical protein RRY18_00965, partial [Clostridia bacterium]
MLSLLYGALSGQTSTLNAMIGAGAKALKLSFELVAVYCVWLGFFNVLEECKAVTAFAKALKPLLKKLFGNISDEIGGYIALNMSSNLLGIS